MVYNRVQTIQIGSRSSFSIFNRFSNGHGKQILSMLTTVGLYVYTVGLHTLQYNISRIIST